MLDSYTLDGFRARILPVHPTIVQAPWPGTRVIFAVSIYSPSRCQHRILLNAEAVRISRSMSPIAGGQSYSYGQERHLPSSKNNACM